MTHLRVHHAGTALGLLSLGTFSLLTMSHIPLPFLPHSTDGDKSYGTVAWIGLLVLGSAPIPILMTRGWVTSQATRRYLTQVGVAFLALSGISCTIAMALYRSLTLEGSRIEVVMKCAAVLLLSTAAFAVGRNVYLVPGLLWFLVSVVLGFDEFGQIRAWSLFSFAAHPTTFHYVVTAWLLTGTTVLALLIAARRIRSGDA